MFGAAQAGGYPSLSKVTRSWFPLRTRTTMQGLIASFFGRSGGAMSSIIMGTLLMGHHGSVLASRFVCDGGRRAWDFAILFYLVLPRTVPKRIR